MSLQKLITTVIMQVFKKRVQKHMQTRSALSQMTNLNAHKIS